MARQIRCVAFDAVGTLIYPEPSVSHVYWTIGKQHGSGQTVEQVRSRFNIVFQELSPGIRGDYSTSEREETDRWRHIVERVLFDATDFDSCFDSLYRHFGESRSWRAFPDVAETLECLARSHVAVLVASNFDARLNPVCDGLPELNGLQSRVISATIGWHKPSARFYDHVIESAGIPANQILMVGDDFDNDVAAARACGLQAVWLNRAGQASADCITDLRHLEQWIDSQ